VETKDRKILVVGAGSIGQRHVQNLSNMGMCTVGVADPDSSARRKLREVAKAEFETFREGLEWDPEIVLICTPNHLHLEQALTAARSDCHLFVEKPLAHEPDDRLHVLVEEVDRRGLTSMVGCNMRFHPGPKTVKELLEQPDLGAIHFARLHTGSYLPEWRPGQDYRESYSANAHMGGGCILDCIHEIDLARWYLGEIEQVFCWAGQQSSLDLDVEDVAVLVCEHGGGAMSEIHLDYVQRTYERGCQVVGENGSVSWDFEEETVEYYNADQERKEQFSPPEGWSMNQMYIDELHHFLQCVQNGKQTTQSIGAAAKLMRTVFAAKTSSRSKKMEAV